MSINSQKKNVFQFESGVYKI